MDNLLEIVLAVLGSSGLTSLITFFIQRNDRKKEMEDVGKSSRTKMLVGLGHDRLLTLTDSYIRRGAITLKEKRNLRYLYEPYKELGGNGDCEIGYDACQKLPVISEDEAERMDGNV